MCSASGAGGLLQHPLPSTPAPPAKAALRSVPGLSGILLPFLFFWGSQALTQGLVPISVDWRMGPPLQECQGPCEPRGPCWNEEGFNDSSWEPVLLPHEDPEVPGTTRIVDRFFRGVFATDITEGVFLCMSSRFGLEVFLNGQSLGTWGGGCHGNRSVNMSSAWEAERVLPIDVSSQLRPGRNLVAMQVTGCASCGSLYLGAEIARVAEGEQGANFTRGDVTADERLDLSDAVRLLWHLFLGGPAPVCPDAADLDDNGSLEVTDAIYSLHFLFLGGWPPMSPFPLCGLDPTADALGCGAFECP